MKLLRILLIAVVLAASLSQVSMFGPGSSSTASADYEPRKDLMLPRYFEETGFWVQGHFREYWETRGGLFVFGYPITSVFWDEEDELYKQYFQRAIFEYHPENAGTEYEVLLMLLGNELAKDRRDEPEFQPVEPFEDSQSHRYFSATGHSIGFGFKSFWEANDGQRNFGYPISREFDERNDPPPAGDGEIHTVQYFERNRFEWHPQHQGTEYEYLLGLLGVEYLQEHGVPDGVTDAEDPSMPPYDPIRENQYAPHVGYGFNTFVRGDDNPGAYEYHEQVFDSVQDAGFNWIKIQARWSELQRTENYIDVAPLQRILDHASDRGLNVVVSVVHSPEWIGEDGGIPANPEPFGNLMETLASEFEGQVQGWEIWNEQNLAYEVGGNVNPGRYVELLKEAYAGVKAGDPKASVLFGGLTPTGVNDPSIALDDVSFLQQVYAYNNGEVSDYYDHLGAHPGSNNNPPDTMYPNNPGPGEWSSHPSFYFRRMEQQRDVMVANGDADKQVWLTEFGWTTENQAPGYGYGADNSEQEQAQYLVRAYEIAKQEWPWMGVMMVWNLNYSTIVGPEDEKFPWSVINPDFSPRPSYEALRDMPKH
ncbi:MAG: cellulase family glycosylhydrolase [Thermomicrobiaceae bacterium]